MRAVSFSYDSRIRFGIATEDEVVDCTNHVPGAFGPWIVTADEILDPRVLKLSTRLNGVEVQSAELYDLIFDVPTLIAYCSTFTELTPAGVGAFREPQVWLRGGDVVEVEISGIGTLRNPVLDEQE